MHQELMKDARHAVEESMISQRTLEVRLWSMCNRLELLHNMGYDITNTASLMGSTLAISKGAWLKCWQDQDHRVEQLLADSFRRAKIMAGSSSSGDDTRPTPPGPPPGPGPAVNFFVPPPQSNPANVPPVQTDQPIESQAKTASDEKNNDIIDKSNPAIPIGKPPGLPLQHIAPNTCAVHPSRVMGREAWEASLKAQADEKPDQETIINKDTEEPPSSATTPSPQVKVEKEEIVENRPLPPSHKARPVQSPWAGTSGWSQPDPRTSKIRNSDHTRDLSEPLPKRQPINRSRSHSRRARDAAIRSNLAPVDPRAAAEKGIPFVPKVHAHPDPRESMSKNYIGTTRDPAAPTVGNRRRDEEHCKKQQEGSLPSDDPHRISCSVQFWELWLDEENYLWTKIFDKTTFFINNEIVGGHVKRNDSSLVMKSGGFILMTTPDAANRMVQWLCATPFPQPGSGVDHYPRARIPTKGVCICHKDHRNPNCIKHLWFPRPASMLIEMPKLLHQIDIGEAFHGVQSGQCIACHEFGHIREECPTLKDYIEKYQSDYECTYCGALNHHLSDTCVHHSPNVWGGKMIYYAKRDRPFQ